MAGLFHRKVQSRVSPRNLPKAFRLLFTVGRLAYADCDPPKKLGKAYLRLRGGDFGSIFQPARLLGYLFVQYDSGSFHLYISRAAHSRYVVGAPRQPLPISTHINKCLPKIHDY